MEWNLPGPHRENLNLTTIRDRTHVRRAANTRDANGGISLLRTSGRFVGLLTVWHAAYVKLIVKLLRAVPR